MERKCTGCSYPNLSCELCPLTVNYWTSLPHGFVISSSGTSSPGVSEARIREIVKEELSAAIDYAKLATIIFNARGSKTDGDAWKHEDFLPTPSTGQTELSFEEVLTALKAGKRVTNTKWNGDNQYVFMMPGYESVQANETLAKTSKIPVGLDVCIAPYLMMRNAQGIYSNWVPSNGDLFSNSWKIIEDPESLVLNTVEKWTTTRVFSPNGPSTSTTVQYNKDYPMTSTSQ